MTMMKIKGIKKTTCKTTGKVYFYDRGTGEPITSDWGTADFLTELEAIRSGGKEAPPPKDGTFGALVYAYKVSPEFEKLSDRSKKDYNRVLDYLMKLRGVPISAFTPAYILAIRDKAYQKHKFRFANYTLAVLSRMFNWGTPREFCSSNPTQSIEKIKRPKDLPVANRAWTDHEKDVVLAAADNPLATAIALGRYTGMREGDVVALPLNAVCGDYLIWRQAKTGEEIEIRIHRDLKQYIEEAQSRPKRKGTTLVIGVRGRPYTVDGFRARFFKLIKELEKDGKVGKGLTFHGLRHSVGTELAEKGGSDSVIQNALGQQTPTMAQRYRRSANKKQSREAAITLLETPND